MEKIAGLSQHVDPENMLVLYRARLLFLTMNDSNNTVENMNSRFKVATSFLSFIERQEGDSLQPDRSIASQTLDLLKSDAEQAVLIIRVRVVGRYF